MYASSGAGVKLKGGGLELPKSRGGGVGKMGSNGRNGISSLCMPQKHSNGHKIISSLCMPHNSPSKEYPSLSTHCIHGEYIAIVVFCVWLLVVCSADCLMLVHVHARN